MTDNISETIDNGAQLRVEQPNYERIPHWVLFHPDTTANAVRLYLVLQSYAMGRTSSFPSRRSIAERMGVSIPTVDAAREVLTKIGALTEQERRDDRGDRSSNLYTLRWQEFSQGSQESLRPPIKESLRPSERKLYRNTYIPNTDIPEAHSSIVRKPVDLDSDPMFVAFWSAYPRRDDKGHARKAWAKAIRKDTPEAIIAGAAKYRDDPNREKGFTALPATWLNGERWQDGPLPPREGRSERKVGEVQSMIDRAAERDAQRGQRAIS
jgi:hypothetical protein